MASSSDQKETPKTALHKSSYGDVDSIIKQELKNLTRFDSLIPLLENLGHHYGGDLTLDQQETYKIIRMPRHVQMGFHDTLVIRLAEEDHQLNVFLNTNSLLPKLALFDKNAVNVYDDAYANEIFQTDYKNELENETFDEATTSFFDIVVTMYIVSIQSGYFRTLGNNCQHFCNAFLDEYSGTNMRMTTSSMSALGIFTLGLGPLLMSITGSIGRIFQSRNAAYRAPRQPRPSSRQEKTIFMKTITSLIQNNIFPGLTDEKKYKVSYSTTTGLIFEVENISGICRLTLEEYKVSERFIPLFKEGTQHGDGIEFKTFKIKTWKLILLVLHLAAYLPKDSSFDKYLNSVWEMLQKKFT